MKTNTIKYGVLETLADADEPLTCAELYDAMPEEKRPKPKDPEAQQKRWDNLTSHTANLYGDQLVDRNKRDAPNKPYQYWLAAKGVEALKQEGHYDGRESPEAMDFQPAEGVAEPACSEVAVQDVEELNAVLGSLHDHLTALEEAIDDVDHLEAHADRVDSRIEDIYDRLHSVEGRVRNVDDHTFGQAIRALNALDGDGYGLYEYEHAVTYGGKVQEVRVKAKPPEKCERGPRADREEQAEEPASGDDDA